VTITFGELIALGTAIVGGVVAALSLVFRLYVAEQKRGFDAMREDRDFWRQEADERATLQGETLRTLAVAVESMRGMLAQLLDEQSRGGRAVK
jgi:hypothetical protein